MKLSPEYMAGFFDGEGCIIIAKRSITLKSGEKAPWYTLVTCLVNTHLPVLTATRKMFESGKKKIYADHGLIDKPKVNKQRKCYMWHAASDIAEDFLKHIRPHLIVKADEADLAFKFRDHVRKYKHAHRRFVNKRDEWMGSDLYKKIQSERHAMYLKMKELKRPDFSGSVGIAMNSEKAPSRKRKGNPEPSRRAIAGRV